ncbi:unnamed protein product [Agarophyton chilense]
MAFSCRTEEGGVVYPYVYFKRDPRQDLNAKMFIGAPDSDREPADEEEVTTKAPRTTSAMEAPGRNTKTPPSNAMMMETPMATPMATTSTTTTTAGTDEDGAMESMPRDDAKGKMVCRGCGSVNFDEVNRYRARLGLSQLRWNDKMAREAAAHSKDMYERKYFEHSELPYAENIAMNWGSHKWADISDAFFEQWKNSPRHDANMKNGAHECGGVGIYGDGDKFYGTQVFSRNC